MIMAEKQSNLGIIAILVGLALLIGAANALYVVRIDQFAIVLEFGKPVRVVDEPGVYVRIPFVQNVQLLDKRIIAWDDQAQEVLTADKKRIYISSFARWRIGDPLKFYTAVRDETVAQMNLDKIIGEDVREVVSKHILDALVRDTDRKLTYTEVNKGTQRTEAETDTKGGRSVIVKAIRERSITELSETFGISLIDVNIKQLNYTERAQEATIRQMISEREKVAARYEAEGQKQAQDIGGRQKEEVLGLQATAIRESLALQGAARAEATEIKAAAFGLDPDFFSFVQTLDLYEKALTQNTELVLNTDMPLLQLLDANAPLTGKMKKNDLAVDELLKKLTPVEPLLLEESTITP
jgi:membrane protease subunit HflC